MKKLTLRGSLGWICAIGIAAVLTAASASQIEASPAASHGRSSAMRAGTVQTTLAAPGKAAEKDDAFELGLVLKSARAYCKRLERAAMDFVCMEEVAERVDLSREARDGANRLANAMAASEAHLGRLDPRTLPFDPKIKGGEQNQYVFDYQFIRKGGQVTEKRVLLEENGKKAKSNAEIPEMSTFQYSDILLAPVKLLDEKTAEFYRYRLLREDAIDGVKAWALEVTPRMSIADRYLGAVVWVKQDDGNVLRIDWDTTTFGHYENILARAKAYESEPLVTSRTEFGAEKHGLRFPSLDVTEEAYTGKDGKKFVRATTRIAYKSYKFFVVETETGLAK